MTITTAWVLALAPYIHDAKGFTKPMPLEVAEAIADEANTNPFAGDAETTGATLAYWAFQESSWRTNVIGDGGRSCGLGQTACKKTGKTARAQVRVMAADMKGSMAACPEHPFAVYAGGVCSGKAARVADERTAAVKLLLASVPRA